MIIFLSSGNYLCVLVVLISFLQCAPSKPGYGNDVMAVDVGEVGPKIEPLISIKRFLSNDPINNLMKTGKGE